MTDISTNAHEYTVSELSGALKRTVEETYGHVRVRGELGRVTVAKSGHVYLDMKDERAVIDAVMWKGVAAHLNFRPEEGLEVIAEGKLSTFPGRSKYQLIIDRMEPAGEGALMALLEARKKALAAEGLFSAERKQALPFLPRTIGVVTSPTGAVIRDILHRLGDRFPVHVLLWPVRVQGEGAAQEIADGIRGLNALMEADTVPTPDLIIVARGGGSIEDLWAFNEEIVVRAAAASEIPLISAVGHETDTTLIDFASDQRAPTPTGAAEIAVPVRRELAERLSQSGLRSSSALQRGLDRKAAELRSASRALGRPDTLLQGASQRLDYAAGRLEGAARNHLERSRNRWMQASAGLRPQAFKRDIAEKSRRLDQVGQRFGVLAERDLKLRATVVKNLGARLEALSHKSVLARGFALVKDAQGALVRGVGAVSEGDAVHLQFADGEADARIGKANTGPEQLAQATPNPKKTMAKPVRKKKGPPPEQGTLF